MSYPSRWWMDGWRDGWTHAQDPPYQQGDSDIEQQRDCLAVCEWAAAGVRVSACGTGWEVTAHYPKYYSQRRVESVQPSNRRGSRHTTPTPQA
jgi:NAD(P)-dependent dehydrogenase (short-subunit alcohol dehydrogenase family)